MPIDVSRIKNLLGDRILIRPLSRPEKRGGLMLPASALKEKGKQSEIWWGEIEAFGSDSRYPDAYSLRIGDVVGVEFIGRQCETLIGQDGEEHCWVAEEFLTARDHGRVRAFQNGEKFNDGATGIEPLGCYILVRPEPEEETRGGIHIPHNAREAQKLGTCIAVSTGEVQGDKIESLHIGIGSSVLFGRYSGSWVKIDEDLLLMKAGSFSNGDVIAVMETSKEAVCV